MTETYFEAVDLPIDMKEELCIDLLEEFGARKITKSGNELKHSCVMPWHNDRKPSARLNFEKLVYGCWSCGSSGGFLWFIAAARGISGPQAREWVEQQTGLGGSEFSLEQLLRVLDATFEGAGKSRTTRASMPTFSEMALAEWDFVHPWLTDPFNPRDKSWGRGIPEQNAVDLRLGYDPERERVVIPHFWKGDLVGWQSRALLDDGSPKYESTGEFPRLNTFYNYDAVRSEPTIVVVESPMSVARHKHHLPITATFGNNITDAQVRILAANHKRVIHWPDPDKAGWDSVEGFVNGEGANVDGLGPRLEVYTRIDVVDSDWAGDAAEIDDDEAERLVAEAIPFGVWQRPTSGALRCLICRECHGGECRGPDE